MSERLVEYLVVAAAREGEPRRKNLPGQSELAGVLEVEGYVQQRLPSKDWPGYSLPAGIERFCRPLGWFLCSHPSCPQFVNFILTQETGSCLYCSSLNFYQPNRKMPNKKRNGDDRSLSNKSRSSRSRSARKNVHKKELADMSAINLSAIEVSLDEECENQHFSMRSLMAAEDMYEPVSLCLVSKYPLFDTLQALLKSIYIYWAIGDKPLEPLVAELLVELRFPLGNKPPHKRSFGPLRSLTLPPLAIVQTLPYTSDSAFMLLKTVGVNGLLQLFAAILGDCKLLFISSSMTALTSAMMALRAIIYPLDLDQFTRVLIPAGLEPLVQAPTPFIHGIHDSLLEELDEEPPEVIMINLDNGEVKIPEDVQLPAIPLELLKPMRVALTRVLDPSWQDHDNVFVSSTPAKSSYWKDKAVRAVFTAAFLHLLGGYRHHVTVLRFHPVAKFHYKNEAYLGRFCVGEDSETWRNFMMKFCDTIGFTSFTRGERMLPFRVCDFFDQLVYRYDSESSPMTLEELFSAEHIQELADEMELLLPSSIPEKPEFDCQDSLIDKISDGPSPYRFSELVVEEVESLSEDLELRWKGPANTPLTDAMSCVPMSELPPITNSRLRRSPSLVMRDEHSLSKCLDAIFNNKIIEARKYLPSVTLSLKQNLLTDVFVPELVNKLLQCGGLLIAEQFELLVRLVNSTMGDESTAMAILPLLTVFYREVQPGINQYMFTCVQKHEVWSSEEFWCNALYKAVQSELVRVYSELPIVSRKRSASMIYRQFIAAKNPSIDEDDDNDDGDDDNDDSDDVIGEVTLRSRQRVRSFSPSRMRNTARNVAHSKDARKKIRASSMMIPSLSEGMLPPDAKPVNSYEALHHLSKRMSAWPDLDQEERSKLTMQEENAIKNQIILFINRIINMRTPVDFSEGVEETQKFIRNLIEFIGRFLSYVETDLSLHYSRQGQAHIMDQMEDMIQIHLDSLKSLRQLMLKVPLAKAKVAKPPPLFGETMIVDGVHAFLLLDGRNTGKLVPADGNVFVTSYRVIFLGTPCDTSVDPNLLVTRSVPVASIYRLKELYQVAVPSLTLMLARGIQLRSTTAELIRLGFDEETSLADFKLLYEKIQSLRYPHEIVRGLQDVIVPTVALQQEAQVETKDCLFKKQRRTTDDANTTEHSDHTQMKLISSISQSPYCLEYERLGLGSLIKLKSRGHWKLNKANLNFVLCNSYPAVWVVAENVHGEFLQRVSKQFLDNRLPIVTWKHLKNKAVLLRSASFVMPVTPKRPVSRVLTRPATDDLELVGVMSTDVDAFISEIVRACPHVNDDLNSSLQASMPPPSLMFDNEADAEDSIRSRLASQGSQDSLRLQGSISSSEDSPESRRRKISSSKGIPQRYQPSLYAALDNIMPQWDPRSSPDYSRTISEEQPMTLISGDGERSSPGQPHSLIPMSSIGPMSIVPEDSHHQFNSLDLEASSDVLESDEGDAHSQLSQELGDVFGKDIGDKMDKNAHVKFASLPTNPRDWIVMDALPKEIQHWESKGLYVIGDKSVLQSVHPDMYQDCTFVPVEVPTHSDIATSFTKLMKACVPSQSHGLSHHSKLFSLVEESEWVNQLSLILQLAGAVASLIHFQGSSVLVCLEHGWDATAQVVSLAQLLMDPHYRTIDGFRSLVEKDWLAFGHPFSRRGQHIADCDQADMSPVFLQFLDCVHQVHRQFPTAFEFNDFYLKMLAYHHASMRFHTFTLDNEKERCSKNWLPYRPRPAIIHGSAAAEPHASLWEYISQLHSESSIFYNFFYQFREDQEMLCPQSYQANLDIWSFYLDNLISQFPPYDTELITEGPLTLTDLHYEAFPNNMGTGTSVDPPTEAFFEIRQLLTEYTVLMNTLGKARGYGFVGWQQLWEQLVQSEQSSFSTTTTNALIRVHEHMFRVQCANMHRTTSMAVLIKGKLALEMEENDKSPHFFEKKPLSAKKHECQYCHHIIKENTAYVCKQCKRVCHAHCYNSMPHICGMTGDTQAVHDEDPDKGGYRHRTNTLISQGKSSKMQELHECEGYLYKKGSIVKNWKLRYFILDSEKRHLAYFNREKNESKLCGKISLSDIVTLEPCEPMNVPVLKAGQAGFFFKLTTSRRVFHLMALRQSSRNVWMQKINAALWQNKTVVT